MGVYALFDWVSGQCYSLETVCPSCGAAYSHPGEWPFLPATPLTKAAPKLLAALEGLAGCFHPVPGDPQVEWLLDFEDLPASLAQANKVIKEAKGE